MLGDSLCNFYWNDEFKIWRFARQAALQQGCQENSSISPQPAWFWLTSLSQRRLFPRRPH